ncbi:DUF3566 domain-containing protein [Antribacter sp. KLBMP9083]|uniref:DUF3566 domain-containing protein n=1 Tax=Antribacter soli TaxID=2910976 RepID=A0AA41QCU5_9MICO|nr:DUF3566 domain-containing protein [Antribacter soli]MCF4120455.1 DUF3566 domain-containing protein [Antribacter soli]
MTTSENSGPKTGTATSPELDEDLDITKVRIGTVPGNASPGSAASSAGSTGAGEIPEPAAVQEKTTAERVDDLARPKTATGPGSTESPDGAARTEPEPGPKAPQTPAPGSGPTESKAAESKPAAEASSALKPAAPTPAPPTPAVPTPAAHESAPTPGTSPSGLSSPVPPSAPPTGSSSSSSTSGVPVQGGIWRSAYAAGDSSPAATAPSTSAPGPAAVNGSASGRTAVPPVPPPPAANPFSTVPTSAASGKGLPGRSAADAVPGTAPATVGASPVREPWNRPVQQSTSNDVPAVEGEGDEASSPLADAAAGVKAGAVKAAAAALAAARSAAKKVSSVLPESSTDDETPAPPPPGSRPEMHYAAGGVRGTAVPVGVPVGVPGVGTPGGIPGAMPGAGGVPRPGAVPPGAPQPQSGQLPRVPAGPRRVRLAVSRVDPWSVMKLAFLLSVAVAIMVVVATGVFWSVLNSLGVFVRVEEFVANAIGPQYDVTNLTQYFEMNRWLSLATLVAICNIILTTALATLMAFLYNITAALVGGVHMTLTDD